MAVSERGRPTENTGTVAMPELSFDVQKLLTLKDRGFDTVGVGLVLLRKMPTGGVGILMGRHSGSGRSTDEEGRWGWFGETLKWSECDGQGPSNINGLGRLVTEEMDMSLTDLRLQSTGRILHEVDLNSDGKRYRVAMHVFWVEDDLSGANLESEEVERLDFFPLAPLLDGGTDLPVRPFTIPVLRELEQYGLLGMDGRPLRRVDIPPQYPQMDGNDSRDVNLKFL